MDYEKHSATKRDYGCLTTIAESNEQLLPNGGSLQDVNQCRATHSLDKSDALKHN